MTSSGSSSHGSATYTITVPAAVKHTSPKAEATATNAHVGYSLNGNVPDSISLRSVSSAQHPATGINETLPPPNAVPSQPPLERWNESPTNVHRTFASFWALFLIGMSDATYGAVIPYMETYYSITFTVVSLIFLSPLVGYTASALLNPTIHTRYGQRGVAILSPACHIAAFLIIALHPPFPVLVVAYILAGFGNGLADAAWNAWVGNMSHANQVLGFLHGVYGAGATVAPLVATALIVSAGWGWYTWYYFLLGGAVLELLSSAWAFRAADAAAYNAAHPREIILGADGKRQSRIRQALAEPKSARVVWTIALFLLGYVGAEVALGGWIVVFMMRERGGEALASGVAATGFWLGITLGRVVLGFVTPRLGEKRAVAFVYLPLAAGLELLFWLVPSFVVSAVAVALQGFFLGPLFPAAVVACTKLLPKHLHVSGIGFAAAFGGSGAAVFPFAVGALAQVKGVQVLQPIILALLVAILLLWWTLPSFDKRRQ